MNWQQQCIELWGKRWKRTLAHIVGVEKRTVMRWATGQIKIKQSVIDKIDATYEVWCK